MNTFIHIGRRELNKSGCTKSIAPDDDFSEPSIECAHSLSGGRMWAMWLTCYARTLVEYRASLRKELGEHFGVATELEYRPREHRSRCLHVQTIFKR